MTSKQLAAISTKGQVVWYDNLSREVLEDGSLKELIAQGVTGLTSNPTIFDNAISNSDRYDHAIKECLKETDSLDEICESLFVQDVGAAADLLLPVWESTGGIDGYASLEVSPELAYDVQGTVRSAKRLWGRLDRPNVMIKVPATPEGVVAIGELLREGINVNVTLIFSTQRYEEVARCYVDALKDRKAAGGQIGAISSVASFFVSRLDSQVSKELKALGKDETLFEGKISVANCRLAYEIFEKYFLEGEFVSMGARVQKPLWASTSTKSERLHPTFYVEQLVAPHTVNTMPPATLAACLQSVSPQSLLEMQAESARACFTALEAEGVDIKKVFKDLTEEGVEKFADSFKSLLGSLEKKCALLK